MRPASGHLELLVRRAADRQAALRDRAAALRAGAQAAAEALAREVGATRVALFGSLVRGAIHERSDVDLAVWGVPSPLEGAAADVAARACGAPVDIVFVERAPAPLARRIADDGVVLVSGG